MNIFKIGIIINNKFNKIINYNITAIFYNNKE